MSELIDLVDDHGEVVRTGVLRDDAESYDGLPMQIVIAVVMNGLGQVLVHQRATTKKVNGGDVDHACGGLLSGEIPEAGAYREAQEEGGVRLCDTKIIQAGVNSYGRYRFLLSAETENPPGTDLDLREVAWAAYYYPDELCAKRDSGELTFVDGFFEDLDAVLAAQQQNS
jgi:8-oxo-dGTP pyrophosphatase MutT (NUDIX family)